MRNVTSHDGTENNIHTCKLGTGGEGDGLELGLKQVVKEGEINSNTTK